MSGHVKYCLVCWCFIHSGSAALFYAQGDLLQRKNHRHRGRYNPGDAHDLWARAYARYMGRYIPEIRTSRAQTCPAAGMIAPIIVYGVAEPDGTTLGSIFRRSIFRQLSGRKEVKFDWAKFTWIGSPEHNGSVLCAR